MLEVLANDGVFIVSFFAIILFGFWMLTGGPMRQRGSTLSPALATRDGLGHGAGRLLNAIALGIWWLVSGFWWLISGWLRRKIIERRARRLAKGGSFKDKH